MIVLGVPTYRRYDLLKLMLASAYAGTAVPRRCVIVDNGGSLREEELPEPPAGVVTTVERPGRNLGVAGGWNRIMHAAAQVQDEPMHVLIVNDDVVLGQKTIENMQVLMAQGHMVVAADGGEAFSCFMMDVALYNKIGQFDEQFYPAYFEDNDYVRRMALGGERFVVAERADGYAHARSSTLKSYSAAEMAAHHAAFEMNKQRYIAKWGGGPGCELFTK